MFKYIEGKMVEKSEHMLSANELAEKYGLWTLNGNPNGLLVRSILNDKVLALGMSVPEYYYPHSCGVMRVYPHILYQFTLQEFILTLPLGYEGVYETVNSSGKVMKINYKHI